MFLLEMKKRKLALEMKNKILVFEFAKWDREKELRENEPFMLLGLGGSAVDGVGGSGVVGLSAEIEGGGGG